MDLVLQKADNLLNLLQKSGDDLSKDDARVACANLVELLKRHSSKNDDASTATSTDNIKNSSISAATVKRGRLRKKSNDANNQTVSVSKKPKSNNDNSKIVSLNNLSAVVTDVKTELKHNEQTNKRSLRTKSNRKDENFVYNNKTSNEANRSRLKNNKKSKDSILLSKTEVPKLQTSERVKEKSNKLKIISSADIAATSKNFDKEENKTKRFSSPKILKKENKSKINESILSINSKSNKDMTEKRNYKGETGLHTACVAGKLEKVQQLLFAGANPNTKDNAGWTPLHEVVSNHSIEIVKLLLENGALPNVPGPDFITPLHEATRNGNKEIICLLLEHGASISLRNSNGHTPVDLANDIIKALLKEKTKNPTTDEKLLLNIIKKADDIPVFKVYPFNLDAKHMKKLNDLKNNHNILVLNELQQNVTHLIINWTPDTLCCSNINTLTSVVLGIPIIGHKWIDDSDITKLANWHDYEVEVLGHQRECVKLSYANRLKMFPKLFSGCYFYFLDLNVEYEISSSLKVNKKTLTTLVTQGGGVVLKREPDPEAIPNNEKNIPFHAANDGPLANCSHFIIYRMRPALAYNMKHLKSLPVGWLIECIQQFKLVDPA